MEEYILAINSYPVEFHFNVFCHPPVLVIKKLILHINGLFCNFYKMASINKCNLTSHSFYNLLIDLMNNVM